MNEIWKDVLGFEGKYQVSNLGNVRSLRYNKITVLKQVFRKDGYKAISLRDLGTVKTTTIHKLVYETFNEVVLKGYYYHVDHIDDNRSNNNLCNLQFISARENSHKIQRKNKTSKYCGVSWDSHKNRWKASIRVNSKQRTIGVFKIEEDAKKAYEKALLQLKDYICA